VPTLRRNWPVLQGSCRSDGRGCRSPTSCPGRSWSAPVRRQLDRYGITGVHGPDAYYHTPGEALEAYHAGSQR
jgi:hypothetical protein